MTYTYTFANAEETSIERDNKDGTFTFIAVNSGSRGWQEYVDSGATASAYVAPPEPEPLTAQQKLENAGLTVDELKTLLGI